MAIEHTLSIIKPDATRRNLTGEINARLEKAGLRIVAQKRVWLSGSQAEKFYEVHKARPFYADLCRFMISGPVVLQVLEGEDAVARNREVMGATDPAKAGAGTIRRDFAELIEANSVHGSDWRRTRRRRSPSFSRARSSSVRSGAVQARPCFPLALGKRSVPAADGFPPSRVTTGGRFRAGKCPSSPG